jgi:hypothetical protein
LARSDKIPGCGDQRLLTRKKRDPWYSRVASSSCGHGTCTWPHRDDSFFFFSDLRIKLVRRPEHTILHRQSAAKAKWKEIARSYFVIKWQVIRFSWQKLNSLNTYSALFCLFYNDHHLCSPRLYYIHCYRTGQFQRWTLAQSMKEFLRSIQRIQRNYEGHFKDKVIPRNNY